MSAAVDEFSLAASVYACYPAEVVTWFLRPLMNSGAGQAWVNLPVELRVEHFALQGSGAHQQVECAFPDRTGRPQHRDTAHFP